MGSPASLTPLLAHIATVCTPSRRGGVYAWCSGHLSEAWVCQIIRCILCMHMVHGEDATHPLTRAQAELGLPAEPQRSSSDAWYDSPATPAATHFRFVAAEVASRRETPGWGHTPPPPAQRLWGRGPKGAATTVAHMACSPPPPGGTGGGCSIWGCATVCNTDVPPP